MPKDDELHVDLVGHDWSRMRMYLVKRLPADDPHVGKEGDYAHYSQPHTMADCPYAPAPERLRRLARQLRDESVAGTEWLADIADELDMIAWEGFDG